jgi:serine/threonine protein kinase
LRFIAPEAISSLSAIGPAADVFSWGMAAVDLINGKSESGTLSTGDSEGAEFFSTVYAHSTRPLPPLTDFHPSMTPELAEVVQRAVSLDPEARYNSFSALIYDLNQVKQICQGTLRGAARTQFTVGHIDRQSRFALPPGLLDREEEFAMLEEAYQLVKSTGKSQVACCWGMSGSGKSKLLELWARQKESDNAGQDCFVGWAKVS